MNRKFSKSRFPQIKNIKLSKFSTFSIKDLPKVQISVYLCDKSSFCELKLINWNGDNFSCFTNLVSQSWRKYETILFDKELRTTCTHVQQVFFCLKFVFNLSEYGLINDFEVEIYLLVVNEKNWKSTET